MTIKGLLNKVESFKEKIDVIIVAVMVDNAIFLGALNKQQLLAGKRSDGADITPGYLEDPYFKTLAQAQAYSDWKDRITPNTMRRSGTPNLFINGFYHDSREIIVLGEKIIYFADYKGVEIERKYTDKINGLGGIWLEAFIEIHVRPDLQAKITEAIGLKFT